MVKRKYIKNRLYFILAILTLGECSNSWASAWLPDEGQYKYSTTLSTIDRKSKNSKNERSRAFLKVRSELDALYERKYIIEQRSTNESRELRNSEIREIETIEKNVKELDDVSVMLASFKDEQFSEFSLEYGASNKQSFGINLSYIIDKFAGYNNPNHNKQFIGKEANVFFKHQLFKNDKWVLSIKPSLQFSSYDNKNSCKFIDLSIHAGYSKQNKNNINLFHEFGFGIRRYFRDTLDNNIGYALSSTDGIKFGNGFMLTNFVQYERSKLRNLIYSHTLYEQFSIAKEFRTNQFNTKYFTAQIGYFWKNSLIDKAFIISGPILSIWLTA